jgi:PBSX family phage terminase large subunit
MNVKLNPWQLSVAKDPHRFKVICAGRRSGKSTYAQLQVLKWALEKVGVYYIVSPTYKQSRSVHWRELKRIIPKEWIKKTIESHGNESIELKNGSTIELKGAENPDALRGIKLRGLVIDEIASIRNWDWLWQEVLRPTLTDFEAPAIFISTPKGYNHFYELYIQGQGDIHSGYRSWKFTSYDNPYIPAAEIDNAKKELTEDTFMQEYMADFRKYTGLVYKEFSRETNIVDPFDIPESWQIWRGIDFGSTNPTACLWIATDTDGNIYIVGEHYATGQTIDYHAGVINSNPLSQRVVQTFGDPSGAQWINEFQQRGIYITPANKETGTNFNSWVRFGIEKVSERLKRVPGHTVPTLQQIAGLSNTGQGNGVPSLFVFSSCTNLIREFETYRWKEKSVTQAQDLNEPDVPEKANDHAMDALRYFVVSYIVNKDRARDTALYGQNYEHVNSDLVRKWTI